MTSFKIQDKLGILSMLIITFRRKGLKTVTKECVVNERNTVFTVTVAYACVTRDVIKNAGRAPSIDPQGFCDDVITTHIHSACAQVRKQM